MGQMENNNRSYEENGNITGSFSNPLLQIEDLSIGYEGEILLEHFNLNLPARGCICLFGPSGCGKTTLLQTIAGLKAPLSGALRAEPMPGISYVFQEDRLIPWLSALENVKLVIENKYPEQEKMAVETAKGWLDKMEIGDAADKYPNELSGGMKQRVNLARAFAYNAPVILLDEPFKGLDDEMKMKIIRILMEQKKEKLLILVTHDKEDAQFLADRIVHLSKPGQSPDEALLKR